MNEDLLKELDRVYTECSERSWDGYGAEPAIESIRPTVERFLKVLPRNIPNPDIGCDPDGEISLDWIRAKYKTISISIGKENRISYAMLDGIERCNGREILENKMPAILGCVLHQFFWKGSL